MADKVCDRDADKGSNDNHDSIIEGGREDALPFEFFKREIHRKDGEKEKKDMIQNEVKISIGENGIKIG